MRPCASGIECGGVRTVVKVRDCLQDMAICVESFWPTDPAGGVPVRIQDDLSVNEVARGDPLVQSLAKRGSSDHVCKPSGIDTFAINRIYMTGVPKNSGNRRNTGS